MRTRRQSLLHIASVLQGQDYKSVSNEDLLVPANRMAKTFAKKFSIGKHLFKGKFEIDFAINHPDCIAPLGIIYRQQEDSSTGTANRKLAFDLASVKANRFNVIFVLGEGLGKGHPRSYMEEQKPSTGQLVEVLSLDELEGFLIDIEKRYQPLP